MFFASVQRLWFIKCCLPNHWHCIFGSTTVATLTVWRRFLAVWPSFFCWRSFGASCKESTSIVCHARSWHWGILPCDADDIHAIQDFYVTLASGMPPEATSLVMLRVTLGASALLIPTVFMGATLPLLTQSFGQQEVVFSGRASVAWLYFVNTAGAALGHCWRHTGSSPPKVCGKRLYLRRLSMWWLVLWPWECRNPCRHFFIQFSNIISSAPMSLFLMRLYGQLFWP